MQERRVICMDGAAKVLPAFAHLVWIPAALEYLLGQPQYLET